jgi:malonyl-CoA O-methyltransferase
LGFLDRFRRRPPEPAPADLATVRAYFEDAAASEEHYPSSIDPRILFVQRLLEHLGPLGAGAAADIGSGKGRFARVVKDRNPAARVIALDLAEAMLLHVPGDLERVAASMTQLPLATGSLDGAWAIESLEHAVDIEGAVAELCRVVKPGGRIFIIDKDVRAWGRFETPAWERWFDRKDLEKLLRRHCRSVRSEPISYWEDVAPDGVFLAWYAVK